jgi:hypothetical protein
LLRLLELRQLGYRFPDDVIDQIDRQSGRLQIEEIESKSSPSAPRNDRAITRP